MTQNQPTTKPAMWLVITAFAALYIIWGSTYLGIRYALESFPPFILAGLRFVIAGGLLYGWFRLRGVKAPLRIHWRSTAIIGTMLLLGGNGGVTWAEQRVPSGVAALMVAIVPLWVVILGWLRPNGRHPAWMVLVGVTVGLIGITLLVGLGDPSQGTTIDPMGAVGLLIATFCWANGTLYSKNAPLPDTPLLTTGMEMLCGGAALLLVATFTGEWNSFHPAQITSTAFIALIYLTIFGSMIAYSAYVWLLHVTTAARAATYAYVNPVVAVFLGWAFAGEPLTPRTVIAAGIIIVAVVIITTQRETASQETSSSPAVLNVPEEIG